MKLPQSFWKSGWWFDSSSLDIHERFWPHYHEQVSVMHKTWHSTHFTKDFVTSKPVSALSLASTVLAVTPWGSTCTFGDYIFIVSYSSILYNSKSSSLFRKEVQRVFGKPFVWSSTSCVSDTTLTFTALPLCIALNYFHAACAASTVHVIFKML